jgi:hypothetical protein
MLSSTDSDSTDRQVYGIDSRCVAIDTAIPANTNHAAPVRLDAGTIETATRRPRAVLYARVSTDLQQKEGTIESQLATLRQSREKLRIRDHEFSHFVLNVTNKGRLKPMVKL